MNKSRTWVVLGASQGLAPAAIRFLLSRHQVVIPILLEGEYCEDSHTPGSSNLEVIRISHTNDSEFLAKLENISRRHGRFDFLINNSSYNLVDQLEGKDCHCMESMKCENVDKTLRLIHLLLPFMKQGKEGHVISLQPKESIHNTVFTGVVQSYCELLRHELEQNEITLTFFESGKSIND